MHLAVSFATTSAIPGTSHDLRNTEQVTGDMPFARGVVKEIASLGQTTLDTVESSRDGIPQTVNIANLARVGERGFALD